MPVEVVLVIAEGLSFSRLSFVNVRVEVVGVYVDVGGVVLISTFWDMAVDASTINVSGTNSAFKGVEDSVQVCTEVPPREVAAADTVVVVSRRLVAELGFSVSVIRASSHTVLPSRVVRSSCFAHSRRLWSFVLVLHLVGFLATRASESDARRFFPRVGFFLSLDLCSSRGKVSMR